MQKFYIVLLIPIVISACSTQKNKIFNSDESNPTPTPSTYWQQQVDYTMDIDMDVENYQYKGTQKLIYSNNSPDVLYKVFYHLYPNAFQPESEMDARLHSIIDPDRRMVINEGTKENPIYKSRIANLKPNEMGFIKVNSLLQNGKEVLYEIEGTILEVTLRTPIKSGEKVIFKMDFTGQVPVQIRRSGRNNKEGVALSMTQWYPKIAVYDFEGWHADPYIAREFYGDWGNFEVSIHMDKNYMIGGTGYLQNPQEIGFGYEDPNKDLKLPKGDKLTWHFKAPNVHDFTWVADKDFAHDTKQINNGTILHFIYKKKLKENWRKMQPMAIKTMEYYNDLIGEYPYKQYSIIQGGDGGMEYGMCTLINGKSDYKGLIGIVMHEMGHAWFQFALATNESKHAWMDEGFTSYIEANASNEIRNTTTNFIYKNGYNYYFYMQKTGKEEPLSTHSDRYKTNMSYAINAYDKGLVFLAQLGYIIGEENIENSLKEYYHQWSGRHPTPNDFIRVAEKVSKIELDWYLNEFTQTTHHIDYGVKIIENNTISLERIGEIPMPIDIQVTYTDGTKEDFYIPLDLLRGKKPTTAIVLKDWAWGQSTYSFDVKKTVKKAQIDKSNLLADVNMKNNTCTKD